MSSYALPPLATPLDDASFTLVEARPIGGQTLVLKSADAARLATANPSPIAPVRVTVLGDNGPLIQFRITALANTAATASIEPGYADVALPAGTVLEVLVSAIDVQEIHGALSGLANALAPVATSGAYADLTGKPTLGSIATHAASDYLTPTGNGSGLTGLTGSQISGAISGQAGSVATIAGLVTAGSNVTLSGSGTTASPFVIMASGGGGGSATPGGSSGQIQYNSGGVFAGAPLTTDGTNLTGSGTLNTHGLSVSLGYSGCEHFGAGATSFGGANNTVVGAGAVGSNAGFQTNNTVIGAGAASNHASNTVVGASSISYGEASVVLGAGLVSSANNCILIGANLSSSNGARGAIGATSTVSHRGAFAIGWGLGSITPNELVFGGRDASEILPSIRLSGSTSIYASADLLGLITEFADATPGSHKGRVHLGAYDSNGFRPAVTCEADGSAPKLSFFNKPAVNQPTVSGSWSDGSAQRSFFNALVALGLVLNGTTN